MLAVQNEEAECLSSKAKAINSVFKLIVRTKALKLKCEYKERKEVQVLLSEQTRVFEQQNFQKFFELIVFTESCYTADFNLLKGVLSKRDFLEVQVKAILAKECYQELSKLVFAVKPPRNQLFPAITLLILDGLKFKSKDLRTQRKEQEAKKLNKAYLNLNEKRFDFNSFTDAIAYYKEQKDQTFAVILKYYEETSRAINLIGY